ncbi:MAG: type II secretion system F family protein, partial [Desulfamplus sp.]|nr:type II secretion system F family protein [Desulfamplus sp.]
MKVFVWKAKNPKNKIIKGEMEAEKAEQVIGNLQRKKLTPIKVKEK